MKKTFAILISLALIFMLTACIGSEEEKQQEDIGTVVSMTQALKVASVDPSYGFFPPDTITLVWKCGGDGSVTVTPSDYENEAHKIAGATVAAQSKAASASGASISIKVDTKTGRATVISSGISDSEFLELLNTIS